MIHMKYQSKKDGKDQDSIQSNQDTNGKVKTSQLDITNESQEVSPFPAGELIWFLKESTWAKNDVCCKI